MRSRAPLAVVAVAVVSLAIPGVASAGLEIEVKDLGASGVFDPTVVQGPAGSPVGWFSSGGTTANEHNVSQDKGLFRSGELSTSFTYSIPVSAGTFPYHCELHGAPGGVGMAGKLKIQPVQMATKAKHGETQIGVGWADASLPTGDRFDLQFRVNRGDWKSWKKDTSAIEGTFGKNGNPVEVKSGKTYRFRARSELAAHPRRASDFSPPLKVVVL